MKHEFHNPDNLTPEQVGEGYRLLLKSELIHRDYRADIHCWLSLSKKWETTGWIGQAEELTFRVPLSTWPLPEHIGCCGCDSGHPGVEGEDGSDYAAPTDNDTWNGLLAENAKLRDQVAKLEGSIGYNSEYVRRLQGQIHALEVGRDTVSDYQDELEAKIKSLEDSLNRWKEATAKTEMHLGKRDEVIKALEARISELDWIPFSVRMPTKEDGDRGGWVCIMDADCELYLRKWNDPIHFSTHWRPFGFKKPDTDRVKFEEHWKRISHEFQGPEERAYAIWKAAKEEGK